MTTGSADLGALFAAVDQTGGALASSYNIAPTQPVAMVCHPPGSDLDVVSMARWGMVLPRRKTRRGGTLLINARSETVATSKTFSAAFSTRRCIVPATGWYEWARLDGEEKRPFFMSRLSWPVLGFAGLWSPDPDGRGTRCVILTTAALGAMAQVHDRMPLLLAPGRWRPWLAGFDSSEGTASLLHPPDAELVASIEVRPVGRAVGDVRNDGPELVTALGRPPFAHGGEETANPTLF